MSRGIGVQSKDYWQLCMIPNSVQCEAGWFCSCNLRSSYFSLRETAMKIKSGTQQHWKKKSRSIEKQLEDTNGEMRSGVMHAIEELWCGPARKEEQPFFFIDSDINVHYAQIGWGWPLVKPTAAQTNWRICLNIIPTCERIRMWILNPMYIYEYIYLFFSFLLICLLHASLKKKKKKKSQNLCLSKGLSLLFFLTAEDGRGGWGG